MSSTHIMEQPAIDLSYPRRFRLPLLVSVASLALGACASPPARPLVQRIAPPPSTQVYFYPTSGQSPARQDRDRYECYLWAVKQTGFDPGQPQPTTPPGVVVVPTAPPGTGTIMGAATGAVIGAAVSRPRRAGEGALVGAVAGALIGASSDAARQEQADRLQENYNERAAQRTAIADRQAQNFRRAMTACLVGRGYTVR
jgi:hypothetical protein